MTVLLLLAVVVLVLLNGFFVAAEFALVRVRRGRIEEEAEEGKRGAGLVLRQLDELSRYLAACQLGITFTSLGIGFLGEPAVADIIEGLLGESVPHGVSLTISLALAYLITTSLHITIGEQVRRSTRSTARSAWRAGSRARCTSSPRPSTRSSTCSTPPRTACCDCSGSARPTSTRRAARPRSSRC